MVRFLRHEGTVTVKFSPAPATSQASSCQHGAYRSQYVAHGNAVSEYCQTWLDDAIAVACVRNSCAPLRTVETLKGPFGMLCALRAYWGHNCGTWCQEKGCSEEKLESADHNGETKGGGFTACHRGECSTACEMVRKSCAEVSRTIGSHTNTAVTRSLQ